MTDGAPFLQLVRGEATPEELAAVVALLAARGSAGAPAAPAPRSRWRSPLRAPLPIPGPGAWQASAW